MVNFDVDLVVPFVDNGEYVWRKTFYDYCKKTKQYDRMGSIEGPRFDNPELFEYCLRCVDKFMPWIRKIHLIVSNIEQVPEYINKEKTHIVLHKDIIPEKYLPTFNSSMIEMFITNIEGLSEHFIYINDDMYALSPLSKEDFFTDDGKIKMNFSIKNILDNDNQFRRMCLNGFQHIAKALHYEVDEHTFFKPSHSFTPMIKSHCIDCLDKIKELVYNNINSFRTEFDHNQYIYSSYEKIINNSVDSNIKFSYIDLNLDIDSIINKLTSNKYQIICINDTEIKNRSRLQIDTVKNTFRQILDSQTHVEKGGR